jgi:hypothetical protein
MSGAGGGGGYHIQAQAAAYIAVHILAEQPLHWIKHLNPDIPIAVAEETEGPGDDILIKLQDGTFIELQSKKKLKKGEEFWGAVIKLIRGLTENTLLYGILLTNSEATSPIRDDLRNDIDRLGQGRTDSLKPITRELLEKLKEEAINWNPDIFRRFRVVITDLDNDLREAKTAIVLLSTVLDKPYETGTAWRLLCDEGMILLKNKGQLNNASLIQLLSNKCIQLSSVTSKSILLQRHRWLDTSMLMSKARCIQRWRSLGVQECDAASLLEDTSIGLPPKNLTLSHGTLTILLGEMGAGKSLIGERIFQSEIEAVQENTTSRIPIFLNASDIQKKSLNKAIEENIPAFCQANENFSVIIDEVDGIGVSNAVKLLEDSRVLVQAQPNFTLLLICRPIWEFINAKESVKVNLLENKVSEQLINQLSGQTHFSSNSLTKPLQDAILYPLFAVLLGSYLQEKGVQALQTKEQLLSDLVERSLRPFRESVAQAKQLLGQLASVCIEKAGKAVSSNEFADWADGQKLLDSRLVVEDADGLQFSIPILAHWFAAQHLLIHSSITQDLAQDKQKLELWRYPLVIAIATFPLNRVSQLFTPIVEAEPMIAVDIVSEALAFQGRTLKTPSLSPIELGQHLRNSMKSWITGFRSLSLLIAPHLENAIIPRIGVRFSQIKLETDPPTSSQITSAWVEIAWQYGNEHLPPVVDLPSNVNSDDLKGWKSLIGFPPYMLASWAWKWTLEQTIDLLLQLRTIPVEAGLLSLEAAWYGATEMIGRNHWDLTPIALSEIEHRFTEIKEINCSPMMHHCYKQLETEMRFTRFRGGTHLTFPTSFFTVRSNQALPINILCTYVEDIYKGGFEGYIQLVNFLSSSIPQLSLASILPARLIAIVSLSSDLKFTSISRYWEPLPKGSQNEVYIRWSDCPLPGDAPEVMNAMQKWQTLRPDWWMHFRLIHTKYEPARALLGVNPVTELAYGFLWDDFIRLGWVDGSLGGSGFPYSY